MTAIRADGLYKCYERRNWRGRVVESVEAVRGISFEVQPGEMAAFIGANGAGKSTTLRLLSGVLTPTRGEASICGHRSGTPEAAMRFGFVSGNRSLLWSHMTVRQSLEIIGAIYGLRAAERRERIAALARELDLEGFLGRRGGTLSLGERMRCEMAAAVLHRPAVLLADEPTLGLDIPTRWALRELLRGWTRALRHHAAPHQPRRRRHRIALRAHAAHRPGTARLRRADRDAREPGELARREPRPVHGGAAVRRFAVRAGRARCCCSPALNSSSWSGIRRPS